MHQRKRNFQGFTLLEMLVVLVLVALLSTLLFEGINYVLHLRFRFLTQLENLQQGVMQEFWFRNTIASTITDYQDGHSVFKGNQREFTGLTLAALDAPVGVPTPFGWQLERAKELTILRYQTSDETFWEISRWQSERGQFKYMARDGKWHTQWPPAFGTQLPQTPQLIALEGEQRQVVFTWIVKLTDDDMTKIDWRLLDLQGF